MVRWSDRLLFLLISRNLLFQFRLVLSLVMQRTVELPPLGMHSPWCGLKSNISFVVEFFMKLFFVKITMTLPLKWYLKDTYQYFLVWFSWWFQQNLQIISFSFAQAKFRQPLVRLKLYKPIQGLLQFAVWLFGEMAVIYTAGHSNTLSPQCNKVYLLKF